MQPHPGTATGLVYKILSCFIGYSAHSKLYVYVTDLYAALFSLYPHCIVSSVVTFVLCIICCGFLFIAT
jgi:hypothetical protein